MTMVSFHCDFQKLILNVYAIVLSRNSWLTVKDIKIMQSYTHNHLLHTLLKRHKKHNA